MSESSQPQFSIGVDYGTNSVRALVVDIADGREVATAVYNYPSGEAGVILDRTDPNVARQNPADYIEGFIQSVSQAVEQARLVDGFEPDRVIGIGVDTTGSTPLPVDKQGMPLALRDRFKDEPAAQAWLWKDHTSHAEAAEITEKANGAGLPYLAKCGSAYSSEWYWSKILHCRRIAPDVFKAAYSWVELADFIPAYITGHTKPETMPRGICPAGHKAMFHTDWGGLPSTDFLASLDPELVPLRDRYTQQPLPSDQKAGELTATIAKQVGLPAGIAVAIGAFDAHHGAVGSGCKPGTLVKIIGTSTCDCMVAPMPDTGSDVQPLPDIPGVCGIVPGSVIPGMYGIEAGQSAVGDIFNWYVRLLGNADHADLTREAEKLKPGASGLLALDWHNGNRTILVDPLLTGLLVGQTLHTTAAEVYRAWVEATAFGALTIINRLEAYGVPVQEVVNCGGIAEKNPMVMRIYADVCGRPMKVSASSQTCALGAAIFAAVVGGGYASTLEAQAKMAHVKPMVYEPIAANVAIYKQLFELYTQLHDAFGGVKRDVDLSGVMKQLIEIRNRTRKN